MKTLTGKGKGKNMEVISAFEKRFPFSYRNNNKIYKNIHADPIKMLERGVWRRKLGVRVLFRNIKEKSLHTYVNQQSFVRHYV